MNTFKALLNLSVEFICVIGLLMILSFSGQAEAASRLSLKHGPVQACAYTHTYHVSTQVDGLFEPTHTEYIIGECKPKMTSAQLSLAIHKLVEQYYGFQSCDVAVWVDGQTFNVWICNIEGKTQIMDKGGVTRTYSHR